MQFSRTIALAVAATLSLPASAQLPPPPYRACMGAAQGDRGESVAAYIYSREDIDGTANFARWDPPQIGADGISGFERPDLQLAIWFRRSDANSIGTRGWGMATVSLVSAPRQRVGSSKLQARLASYKVQYRFDGGAFVPLDFKNYEPFEAMPGTAQRMGELALPEILPGQIELQVLDKKRRPVSTVRYTLNQTGSRDALFNQAWPQAIKANAVPASCEEADEQPGAPTIIV